MVSYFNAFACGGGGYGGWGGGDANLSDRKFDVVSRAGGLLIDMEVR